AETSDSRDPCSVPQGASTGVTERLKPDAAKAGEIVHIDGRVLGRHPGIIHYTIGQRRGLGIPGPAPLYVVRLDAARQQVAVGPRESLYACWIALRDVNWLADEPIPPGGMPMAVRVRSTPPLRPATLFATADGASHGVGDGTSHETRHGPTNQASVLLRDGEYGVAPGQACVFYASTAARARVLGGGWIERTLSGSERAERAAARTEAAAGGGLCSAPRPGWAVEGGPGTMRPTGRSGQAK